MAQTKASYASALMTVFGRNWITLSGGVFAGVSALLFVVFMTLGMLQVVNSPYLGILTFLVLPVIFVGGLLLVLAGIYWGKDTFWETPFPVIDTTVPHAVPCWLRCSRVQPAARGIGHLRVCILDSVTFCGKCHRVEPEHGLS